MAKLWQLRCDLCGKSTDDMARFFFDQAISDWGYVHDIYLMSRRGTITVVDFGRFDPILDFLRIHSEHSLSLIDEAGRSEIITSL